MKGIATAIRYLMAAGISGDELARAVEDIGAGILADIAAASPSNSAEKTRSAAALRQERYRQRKASQNVTSDASVMPGDANVTGCDGGDVTGDGGCDAAPALPLPPNENNSNPPTPTHPDITPPAREPVPFDAHVQARNVALAAGWKPKRKRKAPVAGLPARPEEVSEQVWTDFLKHRNKVGGDVSDTVIAGFRREADRVGWPLERAISESILRGWRGFKAEWIRDDERGTTGRGASSGHRPAARVDGITAAINDGLASSGPRQPAGPDRRFDFGAGEGSRELIPARGRTL